MGCSAYPIPPREPVWFPSELVWLHAAHVGGHVKSTAHVLFSGGGSDNFWLERTWAAFCLRDDCRFRRSGNISFGKELVRKAIPGCARHSVLPRVPGLQHHGHVRRWNVGILGLGSG